jgi:hypothetical protein
MKLRRDMQHVARRYHRIILAKIFVPTIQIPDDRTDNVPVNLRVNLMCSRGCNCPYFLADPNPRKLPWCSAILRSQDTKKGNFLFLFLTQGLSKN